MPTSVCVFCGSQYGAEPGYRRLAAQLGDTLGLAGVRVIYGGGHVGLMGAVADAAMAAGGEVIGVIPTRLLEREVGHRAITELITTPDMFERKRQMIEQTPGLSVWRGGETFDDIGGNEAVIALMRRVITGRKPPGAICFVDEIEKMIGGAGGDTSGVSLGFLGTLLSYMVDHEVEGSLFVGVPGKVSAKDPEENFEKVWERSQAEIAKALPLAGELGVKIAVEVVWNDFLTTPEKLIEYCDAFKSPSVGAYFDASNMLKYGVASADWTSMSTYSRCSGLSAVDWRSAAVPTTPWMGVRSSWLITERNSVLRRDRSRSRAASSTRESAVRRSSVISSSTPA